LFPSLPQILEQQLPCYVKLEFLSKCLLDCVITAKAVIQMPFFFSPFSKKGEIQRG
jgi:hypothetical protein